MPATTVVNLKGHRDDPAFADVVYVGRAMRRGGWRLPASALASPLRPGPDGSREQVVASYREYLLGRPDLLALLPDRPASGSFLRAIACKKRTTKEPAQTG